MHAMLLSAIGLLRDNPTPLRWSEVPKPSPAADEVLLRVTACGVCHTELDEIEGRLPVARLPIIPGHEVIGTVAGCGENARRYAVGDRLGVGWIHHSDGTPQENLSAEFAATGCDVDGGYAQYMTVPERYAVPIPEKLADAHAAPLMCAGAIGYRALRLSGICDGQPLGLMGFGGSAHLVLPTARHLFPNSPIYVFTRDASVAAFARQQGADWAGEIDAQPPQALQAIIDTTPAWGPVIASLAKLRPGGRLVINAIRKEDADRQALMHLSYHQHLWMEREIKSVANITHADIAEFLPLAAEIGLRPTVTCFPLQEANAAVHNLRQGAIQGANVLLVSQPVISTPTCLFR